MVAEGRYQAAAYVPVEEVRAILVKRDGAGEPAGWLDLANRELLLRGITYRHRHDLFATSPCELCKENLGYLSEIADDLGVPLLEAGKRRGAVEGFR